MQHKFLIVNFPLGKSGLTPPLLNLIKIVKSFSDEVYLVTAGETNGKLRYDEEIDLKFIKHKRQSNIFLRILWYMKLQFEISYSLFKLRNDYYSVIFFIGGEGLILPALISKIFKKELITVLAGFPAKISQIKRDPLSKMMDLLSKSVFKVSDKIVVYSKSIIVERQLQKYEKKLFVAHRHFIDKNKFKAIKTFNRRENIIGYVGTLNELKGTKNLIKAIPQFLKNQNNFKFVFIGDGPLLNEINTYIDEKKLKNNVFIEGWVQHDELPIYLNEFKLLILPSYTEGLPNVIIEAMACGTPVLTTYVGAIPDIIKDNHNGFIMTDNSPKCIERNIIRAIKSPEINTIIENANFLVEKEFDFENVRKTWEKLLL